MANSGSLISIYSYASSSWVKCNKGQTIPAPSSYKGYSTTVVDSARNSKGVLTCDVVIEDVAKVEVTWNFLTIAQFSILSKLFLEKYNGKFMVPVVFFDETLGDFDGDDSQAPSVSNNARIFYPNDRIAEVAKLTLDPSGKPIGYTNVSLHLIDTGRRFGD